jgi:hypothetical protein
MPCRFGFAVTQFNTRLHPPEQIRRKNDVTILGIIVRDFAHRRIYAEDFQGKYNEEQGIFIQYQGISVVSAAKRGRDT